MSAKQKKQLRALRSAHAALRAEVARALKQGAPVAESAGRTRAAAAAAPTLATGRLVTFVCSLPAAAVAITCAGRDLAFVGTGSTNLPSGTHSLFYRVNGPANAAFTLKASGAVMAPISSRTNPNGQAGGARPIRVS